MRMNYKFTSSWIFTPSRPYSGGHLWIRERSALNFWHVPRFFSGKLTVRLFWDQLSSWCSTTFAFSLTCFCRCVFFRSLWKTNVLPVVALWVCRVSEDLNSFTEVMGVLVASSWLSLWGRPALGRFTHESLYRGEYSEICFQLTKREKVENGLITFYRHMTSCTSSEFCFYSKGQSRKHLTLWKTINATSEIWVLTIF